MSFRSVVRENPLLPAITPWELALLRLLVLLLSRNLGKSIEQSSDLVLPRLLVGTVISTIVGEETIDLSLNIGSLGVDATVAAEHFGLLTELFNNTQCTVVPDIDGQVDLVRLVDVFDGFPVVPGVFDGDVVTDTAELTLEADTPRVVWGGSDRGEGGTALGRGLPGKQVSVNQYILRKSSTHVMVVIVVVTKADVLRLLVPVVPARHGVDELMTTNKVGNARNKIDLRTGTELTPSLVVDDEGENRGEAEMAANHDVKLPLPLCLVLLVRVHSVEGGHVLHQDHTEAVGGPVVEIRLNLDVLADEVHAQVLEVFDVKCHGLVAGGLNGRISEKPAVL